jgi:hypothetical protein
MLLDAIATVILAGLMLLPLLNVVVGGVAGAGLLGPLGGLAGILLAIAITALETWLADRLGWRDLQCVPEPVAGEVMAEREPGIATGPPSRRRQSHRAQDAKAARRPLRNTTVQQGAAR